MDQKQAVVITRPEHVVAMRKRLLGDGSHVEVFSEDRSEEHTSELQSQ